MKLRMQSQGMGRYRDDGGRFDSRGPGATGARAASVPGYFFLRHKPSRRRRHTMNI